MYKENDTATFHCYFLARAVLFMLAASVAVRSSANHHAANDLLFVCQALVMSSLKLNSKNLSLITH